jgi:hypothetical protein
MPLSNINSNSFSTTANTALGGASANLSRLTVLNTTSSNVSASAGSRNPIASFRGGNDNNRFDVHVDNSGPRCNVSLSAWNVAGASSQMIFNAGATGASEAMRIDIAGQVGIGTNAPTGALDVYTASNTDAKIRAGNAVRLFFGAASYDWKIASNYYSTGGLQFVNGGTSVFNLPEAGGFGVYTNTPTGLGTHTGASNVSTINQAGLTLTQYGVTAGFYYDRLNFTNAQYFVMNSTNTGVYLGNGSTSWSGYSDSRLKNITGTYTNALNDIAQLQSVKFTWKSDTTNKACVGVIAQSVQPVVPEAVDSTKLPNGSDDDTEYLAVRYTELIPLMIAAIQELKNINETQATTITALTARVAALENK